MNRLLATLLTLLGLIALTIVLPAEAAPRTRCFSETGFCVSGSILTYWERNGGLPVFGYPISEVRPWVGDDIPAQWFERDRLEDHGQPTALYEPIRGFGKVWRENAAVRNTLGWASAPELADTGIVQSFIRGMMIYRTSVDRVYIFYDSVSGGRLDDIPRIP